jgi:hypothetical protein
MLLFMTSTQAQTAATPSASPPPTVSKDCKDLKPKAKQECLKVAKQMERDAVAPHDATSTAAESSAPGTEPMHHGSPVMQTPEEKKAAARNAKPPK